MTVFNIAADNDDGSSVKAVWLGAGDITIELQSYPGVRFTNIPIPNAAPILSATLTLRKLTESGASSSASVWGFDEDDMGVFSDSHNPEVGFTKTTASVAGIDLLAGAATDPIAIDVKDIIQEIVERAGWAPDNAIGIGFSNDPDCIVTFEDHGQTNPPTLEVVWAVDGVGSASGVATVSAEGAQNEAPGTASGTSTVTGVGASVAEAAGASAGLASASGEAGSATGNATGQATAIGRSKWIYAAAGSSVGIGAGAAIAVQVGSEVVKLSGLHIASISLDASAAA